MERGAKVSGSRFYFLTGVRRAPATGCHAVGGASSRPGNGATLVIPPVLVRPEVMSGTGFLGAHADEVYRLEADDVYLVGTSEVPLAGYHAGRDPRPVRRSEALRRLVDLLSPGGGQLRQGHPRHHPRASVRQGRGLRLLHGPTRQRQSISGCSAGNARCLRKIEVPYRVIDTAAGDLGSSAARKFDCEAWVPTQGTYRELTSTSNCSTFQARRLSTRYRDENGKPQIAATLNGTLATTRWLVAILENHQQPDGSVRVPDALVPYVGRSVLDPMSESGGSELGTIELDEAELRTWFGFGVAGNFAGHLEQAGEAADFVNVDERRSSAPKGIFPWYAPGFDGFLGEFPLSHDSDPPCP